MRGSKEPRAQPGVLRIQPVSLRLTILAEDRREAPEEHRPGWPGAPEARTPGAPAAARSSPARQPAAGNCRPEPVPPPGTPDTTGRNRSGSSAGTSDSSASTPSSGGGDGGASASAGDGRGGGGGDDDRGDGDDRGDDDHGGGDGRGDRDGRGGGRRADAPAQRARTRTRRAPRGMRPDVVYSRPPPPFRLEVPPSEPRLRPTIPRSSYGARRSARQLPSAWSRKCSRSWRRSGRPCHSSTASGRSR